MADNEASLLLKIKQSGGEILDHFVITLGEVAEAAKKVGEFLYSFVEAWDKQEQAVNKLSTAMVTQGIYSSELREKYEEQAKALSAISTYSDVQVTSAQAALQAYVGQKEITTQLTKATLDFATATGMDLNSAASLMGKTIGGNVDVLKRYGIEINSSATTSERMAQAIKGVEDKFHGQAEAATAGLGSITQLKNTFEEIQATIGARFGPVLVMATKSLNALFKQFGDGGPALDLFVGAIQGAAQQAIMFARDFDIVGKVLGNVIGGVVGAVQNLIEGNWKGAWDSAKSIVSVSAADIEASNATMNSRLKAMDEAFFAAKETHRQDDAQKTKDALDRAAAVRAEADAKEFLMLDAKQQEINAYNARVKLARTTENDGFHTKELQADIQHYDKLLSQETNFVKKAELQRKKDAATKQLENEIQSKSEVQLRQETYGTIATLSSSSNSALASIGKAAGITQIAIDTPIAISKALAAFPPPFSFVAAGLVAAAMAEQAAKIAGVQMAEGGIVPATPGGMQATIGEGGSAEAVIPLDSAQGKSMLGGGGGGMTVNYYGSFLGDETQAMEVAKVLDRAFLKLRQQNQSVAFETDIV